MCFNRYKNPILSEVVQEFYNKATVLMEGVFVKIVAEWFFKFKGNLYDGKHGFNSNGG